MISGEGPAAILNGGREQTAPFLWQRYLCCWAIAILLFEIDVVWLRLSGCSVQAGGVLRVARAMGVLLCFAVGLISVAKIPRYARLTRTFCHMEVARTFAWMMWMLFFVAVAAVLSYLCVTVDTPLVDASLIRFVQAVGSDWPSAYHRIRSHAALERVLAVAYESGGWQLAGIPARLGILGCDEDLADFMLLLTLSSILLLIVSTPFPAASAYVHFNVTDPGTAATVSGFNRLRSGTMRQFDLNAMQGLVSFPSFHTAVGIFFAYVVRRSAVLFPVFAVLNATMVMSTPTLGGHYLVDVFGGLILAYLTIRILTLTRGMRVTKRAVPHADVTAG